MPPNAFSSLRPLRNLGHGLLQGEPVIRPWVIVPGIAIRAGRLETAADTGRPGPHSQAYDNGGGFPDHRRDLVNLGGEVLVSHILTRGNGVSLPMPPHPP